MDKAQTDIKGVNMVKNTEKDIVSIIPETIPEEGLSWEDFFLFLCNQAEIKK